MTTDPVELWSPAESTTRLNKNYYDIHFQPFYRTTQIIIRATNSTPIIHKNFGFPDVQYTSIFNKDFLKQVLDLQNSLSALKGTMDYNETFSLKIDIINFK